MKNILQEPRHISFAPLTEFVYPSASGHYYTILNNKYNLTGLAGKGSEMEQAIRMTRWVNKIVKQKGMAVLPDQCDTWNLLNATIEEGMELNCKGCAIILTDLLLSINLKARMVHCLPKDRYDPESHYLTEYFDTKLDEWIAVDAAFGCIYGNEDKFFGIEKIRQSLLVQKEVIIYSAIGVKKSKYVNKISYGLYKNSYRFEYHKKYTPGFACSDSDIIKIEPIRKA